MDHDNDELLTKMDNETLAITAAVVAGLVRVGVNGAPGSVADLLMELAQRVRVPAIDVAHLERQRAWSVGAFGPGRRTGGIIDHIAKELLEVAEHPTDLYEWVDLVILALDGAWRAGHEPRMIIEAIQRKQERNEARTWPDWRQLSEDVAIEHDRTEDAQEDRDEAWGRSD